MSELPLTDTLEVELVVLVAPELVLLAKGLSTGPVATGPALESGQHGPGDPLHLQQQRCKQQSVLVGQVGLGFEDGWILVVEAEKGWFRMIRQKLIRRLC